MSEHIFLITVLCLKLTFYYCSLMNSLGCKRVTVDLICVDKVYLFDGVCSTASDGPPKSQKVAGSMFARRWTFCLISRSLFRVLLGNVGNYEPPIFICSSMSATTPPNMSTTKFSGRRIGDRLP